MVTCSVWVSFYVIDVFKHMCELRFLSEGISLILRRRERFTLEI